MNLETLLCAPSSDFDESVRLLLVLHDLIAQGKGDDLEADQVRDQMEAPWCGMTDSQQELVNGLSADLYTIGGERERHGEPTGEATHGFERAVQHGNWDEALRLVRLAETTLPPDEVAFVRGICWMHLNQPSVAMRFFDEVERHRTLSDSQLILVLTCLMQGGRFAEAADRAEHVSEAAIPLLQLKAGIALSVNAERLIEGNGSSNESGGESKASRQRSMAVEFFERALPAVEEVLNEGTARSLWRSSLLHLALDYQETGQTAKALSACRKVIEQFPNDFDAQFLLDWLTFETDPVASRQRLRSRLRRHFSEHTSAMIPTAI